MINLTKLLMEQIYHRCFFLFPFFVSKMIGNEPLLCELLCYQNTKCWYAISNVFFSFTTHIPKYSYSALCTVTFDVKNFNDFVYQMYTKLQLYPIIYCMEFFHLQIPTTYYSFWHTLTVYHPLKFLFSSHLKSIVIFMDKYWYHQWILVITS